MSLCMEPGVSEKRVAPTCFVIVPEWRDHGMLTGAPYRDDDGVVVCESREGAEDYLCFHGLTEGWRVRASSAGEVVSLDLAFGRSRSETLVR